jgi:ProP effector
MNEWRAQVDLTIELLCREFPACFVQFERRRRPLKIGIVDDILARLGDQVDRQQLGPALRYYVSNLHYRMALQPGVPRIDLDGHASGTVSESDAAGAAADVATRKTARAQKKQPAMQKPAEPELTAPAPSPEPGPGLRKPASLADLREAARKRREMAA